MGPSILKAANAVSKGASKAWNWGRTLSQTKVEEKEGEDTKEAAGTSTSVQEGLIVKGKTGTKCKEKGKSKNKGDCAEKLVNEKYDDAKYEVFDTKKLENKSGHGIDNVFSKNGKTVIVETKANTAGLNAGQKLGGAGYLAKQLGEMIKGFTYGKGRWASYKGDEELGKGIKDLEKLLKNKKDFRICRVTLEEDPTGCYGKDGNGKCKGEVNCDKEWKPKGT